MGFAEGFASGSSGMRSALQYSLDKERQDRELALRQAEEDRAAQRFEYERQDRQRIDDAYSHYGQLGLPTTTGGPTTGTFARLDRGQAEDFAPVTTTPPPVGQDLDMAREQALERIAVASRDPTALRASAASQRNLRMSGLAAATMKAPLKEIESQLPALNTNMSGYPMLYTGKNKNGYEFLTTDGDGTPGKKFTLNEAQLRQLAYAHALGENGFGAEALTALQGVHKDIADHVGKWNEALTKQVTTNNQGTHFGNEDANQRITANAAATSAGAAATTARAHAAYYGVLTQEAQQNRKDNTEARAIADKFDRLDPKDQAGPAGQALIRRFNMLNSKPGSMVPLTGGNQRPTPTLSDAEKEAYKAALDEIKMIPLDKTTGQPPQQAIAATYRKYGLDPARFGFESELDRRLKAMQTGEGGDTPPAALAVPGRPMFNAKTSDLKRMASKPRGVSSADAAAAADELSRRQNESSVSAY